MATPGQYQSGTQAVTPLTGAERVSVDAGGAVVATVTTAQIAGLASSGGVTTGITNTAISTAGAGVLTAAGLIGGLITRTGPSGAYTDTTDTAAAIVTAIGSFNSGATFVTRIKNATAFLQTLAAGVGVTLPLTVIIGPWQEGVYFGVIGGTSASPTVTFNHLQTVAISSSSANVSPTVTALATNGAGTITAASIAGGYVNRTTVAAPFTDTTDTGTAIVAANPALVGKVGSSVLLQYVNSTSATATITGGVGVTVSGITQVGPGDTALYVLTQTAANVLTMVGVAGGVVTGSPARTSGTNLFVSDIYANTALTITNSVTPTLIPGLAAAVAVGTYRVRAAIPATPAATGGVAISFVLTTAVISACTFIGTAIPAAAISTATTNTTTSATNIIAVASIPRTLYIDGTFVVSTAGTFSLFGCQNTQVNSAATIDIGGYLELTRIA